MDHSKRVQRRSSVNLFTLQLESGYSRGRDRMNFPPSSGKLFCSFCIILKDSDELSHL